MLRVDNKLWIISDTHFGHHNIVYYTQRPDNHESIMLSEWAKVVGKNDHILHLGDVALGKRGGAQRWFDTLSRLPGKKFLIKGNHDKKKNSVYEDAGFTIIPEFVHKHKEIAFTHKPLCKPRLNGQSWAINIHGHVHNHPYNTEHDGTYLEDRRYINVCVEVMDFKPQRLGDIYPL